MFFGGGIDWTGVFPTEQAGPVACPKCLKEAAWVDQGPITGSYYYCRECKDEVDHPKNTYGTIAASRRVDKSIVAHHGPANYEDLNCNKPACKVCGGFFMSLPVIDVKVGDKVKCKVDGLTRKIQARQVYTVTEIDKDGDFRVDIPASPVFSRCRFAKVIHG